MLSIGKIRKRKVSLDRNEVDQDLNRRNCIKLIKRRNKIIC